MCLPVWTGRRCGSGVGGAWGSEPEQVLFEAGYLSQVIGLRLAAGREIVVKVRGWQDRLVACGQVQRSLSMSGFPSPQLLVAPVRRGQLG
jgi:hypothetical protein